MFCLTSFFPAVEERGSLALTILFWGWCAAAHNVSKGHQIHSVSVLRCYINIFTFFNSQCLTIYFLTAVGECHHIAATMLTGFCELPTQTLWGHGRWFSILNTQLSYFFYAFSVCAGLLAFLHELSYLRLCHGRKKEVSRMPVYSEDESELAAEGQRPILAKQKTLFSVLHFGVSSKHISLSELLYRFL